MNPHFSSLTRFAMIAATAGMTACATGADARHGPHHSAPPHSQPQGGPGSGPSTTDEQANSDMTMRCRMYREMDSKTQPERGELMEEQLKGMSQEERQQHMQMMRDRCK
jgi:hypothetical protein